MWFVTVHTPKWAFNLDWLKMWILSDSLNAADSFSGAPPAAPPKAGQRQPAGQQPGGVAEPSVQVGVQLGHAFIQHAADLLPVQAAAGRKDDELGQSLEQV